MSSSIAKPSFTSLPPEVLLSVVSHLSPSAYGPLVHTSHHLLRFFSTHAATICNTYILTNYRASAFDLHSKYVDGWLAPSHLTLEVQKRRALTSQSPCLPETGKLLLSAPGPQYLHFLCLYDFEIRTRREMAWQGRNGEKDELFTASEAGGLSSESLKDGERGREMDIAFAYMVGMYAVKPFLGKLDAFMVKLEERRLEEARRRWEGVVDGLNGRRGFDLRNAVKNVDSGAKELRARIKEKIKDLCSRMWRRKRELCFGEIESGEDLPRQSARGIGMGKTSALKDGLLWYYGNAGVLAFIAREEMRRANLEKCEAQEDMQEEGNEVREAIEKRSARVERVKFRIKRTLRKAVKSVAWFGKMKYFESLD